MTFDYTSVIDSETWAFIDKTAKAFPENAAQLSIVEQRKLYNAMCESFHAGGARGVQAQDQILDGVAVRIYQPEHQKHSSHLVYVHGGGFVVGGLESHDDVCTEISQRCSCTVTSIDYRLSPEHKHPAAVQDTLNVIDYLWQQHRQAMVLCGDSAGATLCAAATHAFRSRKESTHTDVPAIQGQVLIYPGLGGDMTRGSYITHASAPMLSTAELEFYVQARCASDNDRKDPLFAPLQDSNFSNLPPTRVFNAECDPLCDDGEQYCKLITSAGGNAISVTDTGLVHGYLRARHSVKRASDSFNRIVQAIDSLLV